MRPWAQKSEFFNEKSGLSAPCGSCAGPGIPNGVGACLVPTVSLETSARAVKVGSICLPSFMSGL